VEPGVPTLLRGEVERPGELFQSQRPDGPRPAHGNLLVPKCPTRLVSKRVYPVRYPSQRQRHGRASTDKEPKTSPSKTILLETHNLSRYYNKVAALESLDLTIAAGECVALMGPNGSGKTTAGELICGLQEPTSGWVRIAGYSMDHEKEAVAARRFLSYVPDNPYLYHDLTVADHLRLVATAHGVAGEGLEQRIDRLLRSLGLENRADFFPAQLSRGMRQKTAIACAVVRPFSVLVLDEPTIGLDTASIETLRDFLLKSMSTKRAILLMTHDEVFARSVSTRMLHIAEGKVTEGPLDD
jgi:ABC-2 type transport system ATP-binding protein